MQRQPVLTNAKIMMLICFISAALMTTLFVYHNTHEKKVVQLSDNHGTIFPIARDIKQFDLLKHNQAAFKLNDLHNHWTLLFFGFTHCANICPTTLSMLKNAYAELKPQYPNLQVVLVSLDPQRDTLATLAGYTNKFHPDFIGVTGKIQEVRKLQSQLGIYAAQEDSANTDDYQIQHTSSVMLINPSGKWLGIFPYGMHTNEFVQAFREAMQVRA